MQFVNVQRFIVGTRGMIIISSSISNQTFLEYRTKLDPRRRRPRSEIIPVYRISIFQPLLLNRLQIEVFPVFHFGTRLNAGRRDCPSI